MWCEFLVRLKVLECCDIFVHIPAPDDLAPIVVSIQLVGLVYEWYQHKPYYLDSDRCHPIIAYQNRAIYFEPPASRVEFVLWIPFVLVVVRCEMNLNLIIKWKITISLREMNETKRNLPSQIFPSGKERFTIHFGWFEEFIYCKRQFNAKFLLSAIVSERYV